MPRRILPYSAGLLCLLTLAVLASAVPTAGEPAAIQPDCHAIETGGPRLYLQANENTKLSGRLDTPPEGSLGLVLRFDYSQADAIIRNESIHRVGTRWEATFDLSDYETGQTFVATLYDNDGPIHSVEGEFGTPNASVTFENQSAQLDTDESHVEATVTVRHVHLDQGGFVVVRNGTPRGPAYGISDYLDPGTHENVTVRLQEVPPGPAAMVAMGHLDGDCNERFTFFYENDDGPYMTGNGSVWPYVDNATVQFPVATPPGTRTPTPSPWPTPYVVTASGTDVSDAVSPTDTTETTTATTTVSPPTTSATTPGFGLGATGVAVIVGAILYRRNR